MFCYFAFWLEFPQYLRYIFGVSVQLALSRVIFILNVRKNSLDYAFARLMCLISVNSNFVKWRYLKMIVPLNCLEMIWALPVSITLPLACFVKFNIMLNEQNLQAMCTYIIHTHGIQHVLFSRIETALM